MNHELKLEELKSVKIIKTQLSLTEEAVETYRNDLQKVELYISTKEIQFGADYAIGFYTHMYSLINRLKSKENLEIEDLSIRDGIETEAYDIAHDLVKSLSSQYAVDVNVSEVCLVAIHIQTAIAMAKEEV